MNRLPISRGKTPSCLGVHAGLIKPTPLRQEDFAVTCPLVPGGPHLVSGSCSSPRTFGLDFLQTSPRGDALVLLLAFGSANTWHGDLHPVSSVPCPAHTTQLTRGPAEGRTVGLNTWLGLLKLIRNCVIRFRDHFVCKKNVDESINLSLRKLLLKD
jgi:hypothetical protein